MRNANSLVVQDKNKNFSPDDDLRSKLVENKQIINNTREIFLFLLSFLPNDYLMFICLFFCGFMAYQPL